MRNKLKSAILLLGDIIIMYISLYFALMIRYGKDFSSEIWSQHLPPFTAIFTIWILFFYISDLYNLRRAISNGKFYLSLLRSFLLASLFSLIFFYLTPATGITPRTNFIFFVIIFAVLFIAWRGLYNLILKSYLPKNAVAVIGNNGLLREIIFELKQKPQLGFNLSF
ncbi:MAG TPA: hypothetical protein VMD74_03465, partial [Candidatus Methylomirabilis sp.]|nr:hypothetical protein [Candidatus Methylomirabilis sp.]